jgi:hypothetical protein
MMRVLEDPEALRTLLVSSKFNLENGDKITGEEWSMGNHGTSRLATWWGPRNR